MNWYKESQKAYHEARIRNFFRGISHSLILGFSLAAPFVTSTILNGCMAQANSTQKSEQVIAQELATQAQAAGAPAPIVQRIEQSYEEAPTVSQEPEIASPAPIEESVVEPVKQTAPSQEEEQKFNEGLEDFITHWEGFRSEAYIDTRDNWTIGYGTLLAYNASSGNPRFVRGIAEKLAAAGISQTAEELVFNQTSISEESARQMMQGDVVDSTATTKRIFGEEKFSSYPQIVQKILIDMVYNMGQTKFRGFKNMIGELMQPSPQWKTVAYHLKDSKYFNQVGDRSEHHYNVLRGL